MAAAPHYTKEQREHKMADFLTVYERSHGLMYKTCDELGMRHETVKKWREKYPDFDERIKAIDNSVSDFVVGELFKKIEKGNTACIMFWIKCNLHWKEVAKVEVSNGNDFDVEGAIADLQKTLKKK